MDRLLKVHCSMGIGVIGQRAAAGGLANSRGLFGGEGLKSPGDFIAVVGDEDFLPGFKKLVDAREIIGDQAGGGAGGFEDARGGRKAEIGHALAADVQDGARSAVERIVVGGSDMTEPMDIRGHGLVRPAVAAQEKFEIGQ